MTRGSLAAQTLEGLAPVRFVFPATGGTVTSSDILHGAESTYRRSTAPAAVAALLTNDRSSVEVLLGAISSGTRLVSLPLPSRAGDIGAYTSFVRDALARCEAEIVVLRDDLADLVEPAGVGTVVRHSNLGGGCLPAGGGSFELVQFSSGSTGPPKPISLDEGTLVANITAILERVEPRSGDTTVSWLPLSHDMGLIGMVLASLAAAETAWGSGSNLVLLEPERFLRSPSVWLDALDHYQATFTAAPDFGYRMAVQRTPEASRDLSSLRHVIIGGEIVRPDTLRRFEQRFTSEGLLPTALAPAYGMAELGVAATMTGPRETWRSAPFAWRDEGSGLGSAAPFEIASSGRPLEGYGIRVDPTTSRLSISTPASGRDVLTGQPLVDPTGWLETNDTGFVNDGWVYVTGRCDDVIVAHGRNLYAPEIEAAVTAVPGIRTGRATAVGDPSGEWVIVAEMAGNPPADQQAELARAARSAAVGAARVAPDHVVLVRQGTLPMTSSGKVQRNEVRSRWLAGSLTPA